MDFFKRVPSLSKPYLRAVIVNSLGSGLRVGGVFPFAAVLARRLGASTGLLAFLAAAPFFGFLVAMPLSRLAFRFRWGVVVGAVRVISPAILVALICADGPLVFVSIIFASIAIGASGEAISHSLLKAHTHQRVRSVFLKWMRILTFTASVPAAWLAGRLLDGNSEIYHVIFPVAGVAAAISAMLFFRLPRRPAEKGAHALSCGLFEELQVLKRDRVFLVFMLVFFIGTLGEKIGLPVTPVYFVDYLDMKYEDVGKAMGIVGPMLGVASYFFWGRELGRRNPLTVLTICMFAKAGRPALWSLAASSSCPVAYIAMGEAVFRATVSGLEMGVLLNVMKMCDHSRVPIYLGIHYWFLGLRGMIGPPIGYFLLESGMSAVTIYRMITAIVLAGGFALVLFGRYHRRKLSACTKEVM